MRQTTKTLAILMTVALLFAAAFWVLDSYYAYAKFAERVRYLLFQEPLTFTESLLFKIPPHDLFVRIAFALACLLGGLLISAFVIRLQAARDALKDYSENLESLVEQRTMALQETQDQLVRSERLAALGQLADGVGHELHNPLGVISAAVYYLKMVLDQADETILENLEMIDEQVRISEKIIHDLLNLARVPSPNRAQVAIASCVARALAAQPLPEGVQVSAEIPDDLPPAYIDPHHIETSLSHLIVNAYQAMPEGGTLSICVRTEGDQILIRVSDTGCGIPKEHMDKLFEPLFTTKAKGIGLGLALSRNLLEANSGRIDVESIRGQGSTFTVSLPVWASTV